MKFERVRSFKKENKIGSREELEMYFEVFSRRV